MMEQKLLQSPEWRKKLNLATRVCDANKNGKISMRDFELVMERYAMYTKASKVKLDACNRFMKRYLSQIGFIDESVELSYDQYQHGIARLADNPNKDDYFVGMFDVLDINGDSKISFEEWEIHCKCLGINTVHARASFLAMDINKSGEVTRDEFVAYHCEFFFSVWNKLDSAILYGPLE